MKTKNLAIVAVAIALVACDKNNDDFNIDNTKDTPIIIASAGVAELTTRAITDGKLVGTSDSHATMGVFVTGGTADKYNATNLKWEHDGTSWNSETNVLYEGASSTQKIYAYSPYTTVTDNNISVTAADQIDWLVTTSNSLTSNDVNLTMTHALAKLVLIPTFGTELTSQTITSVEVGGMYVSGKLDISDNTWSDLLEANTTLAMANNELLVIPMAQCTSFSIVITMEDARVFKATIDCPVISPEDAEEKVYGLAPGTQYNIKLQIGQDKVTLGGINAEPWVPSTGGVLETE